MKLLKKFDRYIGVRVRSGGVNHFKNGKKPLVFLGGMSRTGNHLLHSLLDGHRSINAIPEEDFFLRTNIGSAFNQMKLSNILKSRNKRNIVDFILKQNKNDYWKKVASKTAGEHKTEFEVINYKKFKAFLGNVIFDKNSNLNYIYQYYIDGILESVFNKHFLETNYKWKLYFIANADFLIKPIMSWDSNNKAIIIYRDPLQRFASHKEWQKSSNICTSDTILAWKKTHTSYLTFKKRYKERIRFVDYNEIVNNVSEVMKRMSDFLGIEYDNILTIPTVLGKPVRGNTSFSSNNDKKGIVYRKSLEKYKKILSEKEIQIIIDKLYPTYLSLKEICE